MSIKPRILKGFNDYLPDVMLPKQRMLDTVARTFEQFGFAPLQTPALEYADVLLGKYGDEGDKLLYRFRDNGDRDVALRYDLTVPLARVVAMNRHLGAPFKRYQIAPVWRAEKPGPGRYREFLQCDVDIVGVADLMADAECMAVGAAVLDALEVGPYVLRVNNRKLLTGLLLRLGIDEGEPALAVLRTVDKLPKIGEDAVREALREQNGLDPAAVDGIFEFLALDPADLGAWFEEGSPGRVGADELSTLLRLADELGIADRVEVDLSIARGLDYYTGTIYETFVREREWMGSVMSGGRYDTLLSMFGGQPVPAVGISLGVDRLFSVLLGQGQVQPAASPAEVLVTVFSEETRAASYQAAAAFRAAGIPTEVYPGAARMKKQFKHADRQRIPFVVVIGPDEAAAGAVKLKDMHTGREWVVPLDKAMEKRNRVAGARSRRGRNSRGPSPDNRS